MTPRAVILGLVGAAFLCGFAYFNDNVIRQTQLVGNFIPLSVYGSLVIFLLVLNPLLNRWWRRAAFTGRELAVVVAVMLPASYIAGRGLMHYFTNVQMMPRHYARTEITWKRHDIVDRAPQALLADIPEDDVKQSIVVDGFMQGLGEGTEHIGLGDVPWYAWRSSLFRWVLLIVPLLAAVVGMALVVHRQWSDHEHLPYPIATFAEALLPGADDRESPLLRHKGFLIAMGVVLAIHLNNYAFTWWPDYIIEIPRQFDFRSLTPLIPGLEREGDWALMNPTISFIVIGFAYFVPVDISFSLGIAPFTYAIIAGTLAGYGVSIRQGSQFYTNPLMFLYAGGYFSVFLVIAYTGRRYYSSVFARCLGIEYGDEVERSAIWGGRAVLAGSLLFVVQLLILGLEWPWALLYTAGVLMVYVSLSRIVAETGAFVIHPYTFPTVMIWGFMGAYALGPQNLLIMFIVTSVILVVPREALMPFVVHALRIADRKGARPGPVATFGGAALAIGLAVAIPVTLYIQYDRGVMEAGNGWTRYIPRMPHDATVKARNRLDAQGKLETSESASGIGRLFMAAPHWDCVAAFVISVVLVLTFTAGRLRFSWWPLHPVMFLVLGSVHARWVAVSFLIGCLIKVMANKYGGVPMYRRLKPVMIGLIAGDLLGGVLPIIVGALYFFITGEPPKAFRVLPG
jgi:hypothetical protein